MKSNLVLASVFLLGSMMLVGCGGAVDRPKTHSVTGKVTYKGQPVKGATVTFRKQDAPRTSLGVTKEDGTYSLTTFNTDDGALEGEHVVIIAKKSADSSAASNQPMSPDEYMKKMQGAKPGAAPPGADQKNELPAKYAKPETSGLSRTVVAGEKNSFDFDLTD